MDSDLAVANSGKLAGEKRQRCAVHGRCRTRIDDAHPAAWFESGREVVEQSVGVGDLMVHVDQDRQIDGGLWQPRVVRLPNAYGDVLELERFDTLNQALKI